VDKPFNAGFYRRVEHVPRAFHVHGGDYGSFGRPKSGGCRNMEHCVAAFRRFRQPVGVKDVSGYPFDGQSIKSARQAFRMNNRPRIDSSMYHFPDKIASKKPVGSSDKSFHLYSLPSVGQT
jgi:hypothetical protein